MKHAEGRMGRIFVIRLEDGDIVPDCLESFAAEQGIKVAHVMLIGGIGSGEVVVGPRAPDARPLDPMTVPLDGAHEVAGVGLIAPDDDGKPVLHIHAALGRSGKTTTGCLRKGVKTWLVGEAVVTEIVGANVARLKDADSGFALLQPK